MLVKINTGFLSEVDKDKVFGDYKDKIGSIFKGIQNKNLPGMEMTGWIEWVNKSHSELIEKIDALRRRWMDNKVEIVVVIGTGGSYIGCKAALDFLSSSFKYDNFQFIFVPFFSERYLQELLDFLIDHRFSLLVISKSGTTLESAVAFRLLRELLYKKEGIQYKEFIAAVTDKNKGVLRSLVDKEEICSFVIEDDIGGRYSTLTAVGLVPMVLGGVDANRVLEGAKRAYFDVFNGDLGNNSAAQYAVLRHFMFESKGLVSECIASYDPNLQFCLEKMKQLFAESEGKNGKGLMPVIMRFTPDLHSVGQLLQEGKKSFFETIVSVKKPKYGLRISKSSFNDDDGLDWIAGKTLKEVNECACRGTLEAHSQQGNVSNIVIELESWTPEVFGYFYYWLSVVAMYSSYLFGVNPFDQPGVEMYKKRMFELLGK